MNLYCVFKSQGCTSTMSGSFFPVSLETSLSCSIRKAILDRISTIHQGNQKDIQCGASTTEVVE